MICDQRNWIYDILSMWLIFPARSYAPIGAKDALCLLECGFKSSQLLSQFILISFPFNFSHFSLLFTSCPHQFLKPSHSSQLLISCHLFCTRFNSSQIFSPLLNSSQLAFFFLNSSHLFSTFLTSPQCYSTSQLFSTLPNSTLLISFNFCSSVDFGRALTHHIKWSLISFR